MSMRLPAAARREQLLGTALEVFASKGFHAASMNEVAEAAGVTKPVLYQHFASKRELYLALLEEVGAQLLGEIGKATASATGPREQVTKGFTAYFRWIAADQAAFTLLFGSGARRDEEFADAVRRVEEQVADAIAPLIAADVDEAHQRILARALIGMAEAVGRQLVHRGEPFDPDLVASQVAAMAWGGLRSVKRID